MRDNARTTYPVQLSAEWDRGIACLSSGYSHPLTMPEACRVFSRLLLHFAVLRSVLTHGSAVFAARLTMTASKPTLDIAILGAGIAGLALAIGLLKRGIVVTIYEAASDFSPVGAGIGLGPNSLAAIDLLDSRFRALYEAASTANERPEFEHSVFDALYAEKGFGEKRGWGRGLVGAEYFVRSSAHRRDLLNIMKSLVPDGMVKFDKRADEIAQQTGNAGVSITFQDGETITVDALIGCDGIKGATRKAVLQDLYPEEVAAKYCNMYIYRGILPMADAKAILGDHAGDAKWFMSQDRGVAIYPISKAREENFVFFVSDPMSWTGKQEPVACNKEDMVKDLAGFDQRLIRLLDWASPLRWPIFHHPDTPTYYNGRICLIGDVAHASSPGQAAGAGQGLEDAVVVSHLLSLLSSSSQLESAFEVYDNIRRPRAQKVVTTSQEAGRMYAFQDSDIGDDMHKIVENANQRLHWIWQHDLQADVEKAEEMLRTKLTQSR